MLKNISGFWLDYLRQKSRGKDHGLARDIWFCSHEHSSICPDVSENMFSGVTITEVETQSRTAVSHLADILTSSYTTTIPS